MERDIALGDECGDLQLRRLRHGVQFVESWQILQFRFYRWGHERCEPPAEYLSGRKWNDGWNKLIFILRKLIKKPGMSVEIWLLKRGCFHSLDWILNRTRNMHVWVFKIEINLVLGSKACKKFQVMDATYGLKSFKNCNATRMQLWNWSSIITAVRKCMQFYLVWSHRVCHLAAKSKCSFKLLQWFSIWLKWVNKYSSLVSRFSSCRF